MKYKSMVNIIILAVFYIGTLVQQKRSATIHHISLIHLNVIQENSLRRYRYNFFFLTRMLKKYHKSKSVQPLLSFIIELMFCLSVMGMTHKWF